MSTAHTPGPWSAVADDEIPARGLVYIEGPDGWDTQPICDCSYSYEGAERDEANARLIAAAPDLLAALKDISRFCDAVRVQVGMGKTQLARLDQARVAIAKAEGRS